MSPSFPEIRVGEPTHCEGLSLFPLSSERSTFFNDTPDYLLCHEAMAAGTCVVEEVSEAGSVGELLVENGGDRPVLFLEGAELRGAKQNRAINTTVLIAAKSRTRIPVCCVERKRWSESCGRFRPGSHSPPSLRRVFQEGWVPGRRRLGGSQCAVWAEIRRKHGSLNVFSHTEDMAAALEARRERVKRMEDMFRYPANANGIALAIGDWLVCIDLLDKPSTLEKVWDRLQQGFLLDLLEIDRTGQEASQAEVLAALDRMRRLPWRQVDQVGLGDQYRAGEDGMLAAALCLDGVSIHASASVSRVRHDEEAGQAV